MNQKALINGQEYTLIEILPSLDGGQPLILCEDGRVRGRYALNRCGAAVL